MNRQQRRRAGKPQGISYAEQIARKRMLTEAAQLAANDTMVRIRADVHSQKIAWLIMLALNDEFQFGETRFNRLAAALTARTKWYDGMVTENDEDYATGKLQDEVQRATHQQVELAWDKELAAAKKRHENDILTNYDRLRTRNIEKLAETLCNWLDCQKCPGREMCSHSGGKANGLAQWLKQEEEKA